jgi:acyl carrier protein
MPHLMITERVLDTTSITFHVPTESLRLETRFRELGDDLTVVEYFMHLEEDFGAEIEDEEAEQLQTVFDVIELFRRKLGDDS